MKFSIKINQHIYQVDIENLDASPVVALVDGQPVEVWPEALPSGSTSTLPQESNVQTGASEPVRNTSPSPSTAGPQPPAPKTVHAPIPGVILAVNVAVGDEVAVGQELFVIEAMKMRNAIRSNRSGKVSLVNVVAGQTVNHHDVLMEFGDQG